MSVVFTSMVAFLLVISVLVFVHEWGHYRMARQLGIPIEVFSIGFGPKLWSWRDRFGTLWTLSLIPMGGYVKPYQGMDNPDQEHHAFQQHALQHGPLVSFEQHQPWKRILVALAGPLINYLFAFVVLAGIFMTVGSRRAVDQRFTVVPGSLAEKAQLPQDKPLISVNGESVTSFASMAAAIQKISSTEKIVLEFQLEENQALIKTLDKPEKGGLGLKPLWVYEKKGWIRAIQDAGATLVDSTVQTLTWLQGMMQGKRSADEMAGPLKMAHWAGMALQNGWTSLLELMANISIGLGLMNLFPLPFLDGGQIVLFGIEACMRRPLSERASQVITYMSIALFTALMLFVFYNDVRSLFWA